MVKTWGVNMKMRSLLLLTLVSIVAAFIVGCSGGGDDALIAKIGDREITKSYYEDRLGKLQQNELPTKDGESLDTAMLEGKQRFLEVLIDKELMALKAFQLGYGNIDEVKSLKTAVTEYKAGEIMHQELVVDPAQNVSQAEIAAYHENTKQKRHFHFILCNFEEDALKARDEVLAGGLWEDVADKYNDGSSGPAKDYTLTMEYGRSEDTFEKTLFGAEIGEVLMPFFTVYGYWVVRLDQIEEVRVPELDEAYVAKIKQTLIARKVNLSRADFIAASRIKHNFTIDNTALWIVYQGLPNDEPYINPDTNKPYPKESLIPIDVEVENLSREFFSCQFDLSEEPTVWTIGDYKALYDDLNVFQRPKKSKLLNGVKLDIMSKLIDKKLLIAESSERGYFENKDVYASVKNRTEEMIVTKLFNEVIVINERVTPKEINEFWTEYSFQYVDQETGQQIELAEVRESVGDRIKANRKDKVLRDLLVEWQAEFGVEINEKALMGTACWAELVPLENSPLANPGLPAAQ
jgi:peptidyl-prolyl cis-trans isomerase C